MTAAPIQILLSYLILAGLASGIVSLVMASLARFFHLRRLLGTVALLGFAVFLVSMLTLSLPPFRLINFYFWLFTAAIVGGGIGCVTMRNVFHAALMLILSLFGVSGYFVLVNAEFLAMVQVIIYIGGIMVLFLFGIMVSQNIIGTDIEQNSAQAPWAAAGSFVLFLFMALTGLFMTFPTQPSPGQYPMSDNNTQSLGWSLMATYTLPFECASLLLLMAMLGAIVLVRKE
jgi:NADH:ubiquinone oxidoreductase subunit 6 (subunit J)